MLRHLLPLLLVGAMPALADVPRVATDIAPVQGLVAAVLGDLGQPELVVPKGASPHDHALRPSEARALQGSDLVVWIGPDLMPNLVKPLETLASDSQILTLADLPGTHLLDTRTSPLLDALEEQEHEEEDHDHGSAHDPHIWLEPDNALLWLDAIAERLVQLDPDNAAAYKANAAAAGTVIAQSVTQALATLDPVREEQYLSLHDAYQYFEHSFGLHPMGAVSLSDARAPGPARLATLRDALSERPVTCVLAEPGAPRGFLRALGDPDRLTVTELDPLGAQLPDGPAFYPSLITDTAERIADCLAAAH